MTSLNLSINFLHEFFLLSLFIPYSFVTKKRKKEEKSARYCNNKKGTEAKKGEGDKKLNVLTIKLNPEADDKII